MQGISSRGWHLQFLWNDYPWLTAATAQGGDLTAAGSVQGNSVQVTDTAAANGSTQQMYVTGRYVQQDSNFPFQTLSLGIQQVFVNNISCVEVPIESDGTAGEDEESALEIVGADSCYLPLIESRVLALNASSLEEAQKILSPLCTQQFCCSQAGQAQGPASQAKSAFSFLPGPAQAPGKSAAASKEVPPKQARSVQACCSPDT